MTKTNGKDVSPSGLRMSYFIQQNRSYIVTCAAVMGIVLYLNWTSLLQKQQEKFVQQSFTETLEILHEMETRSLAFYTQWDTMRKQASQQSGNSIGAEPPAKVRNKDEFSVADRGFWQGLGATKGHIFDAPLAQAIVKFLKNENVTTLLELGAGTGTYAKQIKEEGILVSCYDGNPETQDLSGGRCGVVDLSKPIDFSEFEWTLSLEVGEHIPKEFEDIFISNLVRSKYGLIISWAIEGQGGTSHVNNRNNTYIRNKIAQKGYTSDFEMEKTLRAASTFGWFKNTIMVFRKQL